jgi:hypothetical protein
MNRRRSFTASIVLAIGIVGYSALDRGVVVAQPPIPRRAPRLFKDSRQSLAVARALGQSQIVLVVAAATGRTRAVAADARRLGGEIRYQDDELGYLRVRLPLDAATEFSESVDVEAIAADWDTGQALRLPSTTENASPVDAPLRDPLRDPYSPLAAIDAAALRTAHPTYDGRGVTIAVFDGTPDILLPEFETAYDLDGGRVPKIAGVLNVTDPRDDADRVPRWVNMSEEVRAAAGRVMWRGRTYTTPHNGRFRIGVFDERRLNGPFTVLWDETNGDVWVDTNRNLTFLDGPMARPTPRAVRALHGDREGRGAGAHGPERTTILGGARRIT